MSEQSPYQILGVKEDASFEEIQEAKQRLSQQYHNDSKVKEAIEAAYDAVIMDRLRLRQEGKIKVPEKIRFPEREKPPENPLNLRALPVNNAPTWLKGLIKTSSPKDMIIATGVYGIFIGATLIVQDNLIPLLLTLGIFANGYFLNRKDRGFWRSVLFSLISLFLGMGIGSLLVNSLGLNMLSAQQVYALVTFVIFWLCSICL